MGVDCKWVIPSRVNVFEVIDVIVALAGIGDPRLGHTRRQVQRGGGVMIDYSLERRLATIELHGLMVDGETGHEATYWPRHKPECPPPGWPRSGQMLLGASSPFWCAIAQRLVARYGGAVDYAENRRVDYQVSAPARRPQRTDVIAPLTRADLSAMEAVSASKLGE